MEVMRWLWQESWKLPNQQQVNVSLGPLEGHISSHLRLHLPVPKESLEPQINLKRKECHIALVFRCQCIIRIVQKPGSHSQRILFSTPGTDPMLMPFSQTLSDWRKAIWEPHLEHGAPVTEGLGKVQVCGGRPRFCATLWAARTQKSH